MKYFLTLLLIISSTMLIIPYIAFGEKEQVFYGNSEFQRLPTIIGPDQDYRFEIKVHYTQGLYAIKGLTPIIDVYPASFSPYITITTKSIPADGILVRGSVARIHGTITTNSSIPEGRISLVAYFVAKNIWNNPVKSAWNTSSDPINVESKILGKDFCDDLSKFQSSPIELEYEIDGGKVVAICHRKDTNSIVTKIDAESDGHLTIIIPKNIIYSLSGTDCSEDSDLMILMDNEEVLPTKSIHTKKDNIITVGFYKDVNTIEFVGFSIMPDPSPAQYCGIVMGFDSLYLPPKFQTDLGMKAEQIKCNEGLTLLKKASNDNPACVKPETLEKLRERGWTSPLGEIIKQRIGQTSQDLTENHDTQKVFLSRFKDSYEINESLSFIITVKAGQKCGPIDVTTIDINTSKSTGNATIEPLCNSKYLTDDLEAGFEMGGGMTPFRTDKTGSYKIVITFEGKPQLEKEFVVKESTK